jgi:hypothetical protein
VSDLLGRIAARAVGAPALAQPRLPVSLAGQGAAGLEVVDEELVVPADAPRRVTEPPAEPRPSEPAQARPATPAREAKTGSPVPVPPAAAPPGSAVELPRQGRLLPALEPVLAVRADAEPDALPAEPRAAAPVTVVPAAPATPALAGPAAPAVPAAVAAARDEPPPVRVHIGRLEVRASLGEPPRPQPLPQAREPEGLSLSDYLRGRHDA